MASNQDDSSVKVAVRVRPLNGKEVASDCEEVVHITSGAPQISIGENRSYTFDYVFGPDSKQRTIYDQCVESLVEAFFEGFNATILAYGQTGSGKTFTMGTSSNMGVEEEMQGIVPRVIVEIFDHLEQKRKSEPHIRYILSLQFLEIYGEDLKDLLDPSSEGVRIHEDFNGNISVHNAKEEVVNSVEELMLALEKGSVGRITGSTLMNAHSSRSHAIFTLVLEQRIASASNPGPLSPSPKIQADDSNPISEDDQKEESLVNTSMEQDVETTETRKSKFHFVDLAGSERLKKTGATGQRMKEGIDINKGLLVLGNVISALGDDKLRGKVHVPYRDSKLTRMLQDSLGGNSKTLFICCCSPADANASETESALSYANRARNIKNKPVVNRDPTSALIAEMKQQLQLLATELLRAKTEFNANIRTPRELLQEFATTNVIQTTELQRPGTASSHELGTLHSRVSEADAEVQRLSEEIKKMRTTLCRRDEQLTTMRAERDFLYIKCQENSIDLSEQGTSSNGGEMTGERKAEPELTGGHSFEMIKGYIAEISSLKQNLEESERKQAEMETNMMAQHKNFMHHVQSQFETFMETGDLGDVDLEQKEDQTKVVAEAKQLIRQESAKLKSLKEKVASPKGVKEKGNDQIPEVKKAWEAETEEDEKSLEDSVDPEALLKKQEGELKTEQRNFNQHQALVTADITELTESIRLKEELLNQLVKAEEKYELMKTFYEQKLKDMDSQIKTGESERDSLARELHTMEKAPRSRDNPAMARLKMRLKEKDQELQELRRKQSQLSKLSKQRSKNDFELRRLEGEITAMKQARVNLIRKNETDRKRHMQELQKRKKEIEMLRRYQKQDQNQLRKIQGEKMKSQKMLKRRTEELTILKQKHNDLFDRQTRSKTKLNERAARKWLDDKVAEVSKREEELQRLKAEYRRRMMLQRQKKSLEAVRQSMHERCTLRDLISQEASGLLGLDLGLSSDKTSSKKASALTVEEEEALKDIEVQIGELTQKLQDKDQKITDLRKRYSGGQEAGFSKESTKQQLSQLTKNLNTVPQAQSIIKLLFQMLVSTRKHHKQSSSQVEYLQSRVKQLSSSVEEGERKFAIEVRRFDQEMTKAATEYEEKISGLIDTTHKSGLLQEHEPSSDGFFASTPRKASPNQVEVEDLPNSMPPLTPGGSWSYSRDVGQPGQFQVMLRLANERNEALRKQVSRLQSSKEEMSRWLMDLEAARVKDKETLEENEEMTQWLEYDLKTMRAKYSKIKEKLEQAERKLKELSNSSHQIEDEDSDDDLVEHTEYDHDSDEMSVDIPWEDILAIDQGKGKVPDFFQDSRSEHLNSTSNKSGSNIFERLTNPTYYTGASKVNQKEIEQKRQLVKKLRDEERQRKLKAVNENSTEEKDGSSPSDSLGLRPTQISPVQAEQRTNKAFERSASGNIFDRLTNPENFTGTQKKKLRELSTTERDFGNVDEDAPSRFSSREASFSNENLDNLMKAASEAEDRTEKDKLKPRKRSDPGGKQTKAIFDRLAKQATVAASNRIQETKPKVQKPSDSDMAPPPFKPSGASKMKKIGSSEDVYYSNTNVKKLGRALVSVEEALAGLGMQGGAQAVNVASEDTSRAPKNAINKTDEKEEEETEAPVDLLQRVRFRVPRK